MIKLLYEIEMQTLIGIKHGTMVHGKSLVPC